MGLARTFDHLRVEQPGELLRHEAGVDARPGSRVDYRPCIGAVRPGTHHLRALDEDAIARRARQEYETVVLVSFFHVQLHRFEHGEKAGENNLLRHLFPTIPNQNPIGCQ